MEQKHVLIEGEGKQRSSLKEPWPRCQQIWLELPVLFPTRCVTLGESPPLSGPQFISEN